MDAGTMSCVSRVLLTGPPGIGKTTICKKIASMLEKQNCKFDGFYTEEVRDPRNVRIGFDVILVNNPETRSPLAKAEKILNPAQYSKYRVGNYHVFLNEFESVALTVFDSNAGILFIDEIGKMELFSRKFEEKINRLFSDQSNGSCVIATIPLIHKVPQRHLSLFQRLHADKRSKVINVTRQNRDNLPNEIFDFISRFNR